MSLQSTLSTGVSGLQANGTRLSVIGNNIANVNTVGFKSGRVSFNEYLVQSISDARRPIEGSVGGVNPVAFGLGVGIASIDNLFTQGTLESTGVTTDMAIQGEGFFVVREGQRKLYTRAGSFQFDGQGNLGLRHTPAQARQTLAGAQPHKLNQPAPHLMQDLP